MMAEQGTIELINLFITQTDIATGDKLDFISYDKLFQQVFVYAEGDHIGPCKMLPLFKFIFFFLRFYICVC